MPNTMFREFVLIIAGLAIQCYQCDSDFDENCRPDKPFDYNINALVDCLSDEANVPGVYCVKIESRSPGCKYTAWLQSVFP